MRTLKSLMVAVGTVLALGVCAPAAPPAVGDVEKIVALYAEDALQMPPHAPVANGHGAIRAFLTADTAGAKAAGIKLVPGTSTAGVAGDTGRKSGTYTVTHASGTTVNSAANTSSDDILGATAPLRNPSNRNGPGTHAHSRGRLPRHGDVVQITISAEIDVVIHQRS
jgi:hypothetical protein